MTGRWRFSRLLLEQLYLHGIRGLWVVLLAAIFTGQVIIAEYAYHIRYIMHELTFVPPFATSMILTQFGPLLACMLMVSLSGAAIASETGLMRSTEQWDALKLEHISLWSFYIWPRIVACTCICIALTLLNMAGQIVSFVAISPWELGLSWAKVIDTLFDMCSLSDLIQGLCKGAFFGFSYSSIAIFIGAQPGHSSADVGKRSTQAVVLGIFAIIVEDFLLSYIFIHLFN